jgi:uncharacterized protein
MDRPTALSRLRSLESELRQRGVGALFLFGSHARGEASDGSDLDLFFDYPPEARLSLLDVIGLKHFLQDQLNTPIDLITRSSLHPLLRGDIEAEAIAVF